MEKIDYSNSYFTTKGMTPEEGDTLSLIWGRKVVQSLANTYGLIGTVNMLGNRGYKAMNLQLTRKYLFPPSIYLYYTEDSSPTPGTIFMAPDLIPVWGEMLPMDGVHYDAGEARVKPYAIINGDNLLIMSLAKGIHWVYYRIVGV